jgi:hypothetical protein
VGRVPRGVKADKKRGFLTMNADLKVESAVSFKRVVVDPDYADYKVDPINLRRAYHLSLGLFHLRDWTFWEFSGGSNWKYGGTVGAYQTHLEAQCAEFGYIRDLANAVKHAELDPGKKPSTQMIGLANTEISVAAFQPGAFDPGAFQTRTFIVSTTSSTKTIEFEVAADAVKNMWDRIFAVEGWK